MSKNKEIQRYEPENVNNVDNMPGEDAIVDETAEGATINTSEDNDAAGESEGTSDEGNDAAGEGDDADSDVYNEGEEGSEGFSGIPGKLSVSGYKVPGMGDGSHQISGIDRKSVV